MGRPLTLEVTGVSVPDGLPPEEIATRLAASFPQQLSAQQVLARAGLPLARQPGWTQGMSAIAWWTEAVRLLEVGAISPDWRRRLDAAATAYLADLEGTRDLPAVIEQNSLVIESVSAPGGFAVGANNGSINVQTAASRVAAFVTVADYLVSWLDPHRIHHHRAALVGRDAELERLLKDLDPAGRGVSVVLLTGPGGRGKSRLALEALRQAADRWPYVPALVLREGATLDAAAVAELPDGPARLLVEDAHRHSEQHLMALLAHAMKTAGVVILTTRGIHHPALKQAVYRAGVVGKDDVIEVGQLDRQATYQLVDELVAGDRRLPDAFLEHLAYQAIDCPFIAVVAVGLAYGEKLDSGPLALDHEFGKAIVHAFADELVGTVPVGIDPQVATRFLRCICAVAPFPVADDALFSKIADFVKASVEDLDAIWQALRDAHVLVEAAGQERVLPELLADEILFTAVREGSRGFVRRVWQALGQTSARSQLVVNLAEASWRLGASDGSDVYEPVWSDLTGQLDRTNLAAVDEFLAEADVLAEVQAARLGGLLGDILAALPKVRRQPRPWSHSDPAAREVEKVLDRAAQLLTRCAISNPALLADVLDQLWSLAPIDARPLNQTPEHPVRLVRERLASWDRPAAPTVVVTRVEAWLAVPDPTDAVWTPLFALEPLIAKSGMQTGWRRDAITFDPYRIVPAATGDLRRRIRDILVHTGCGDFLHRAHEAVELLGSTLDPPTQFAGMKVTADDVLAWESDDLETLHAMTTVAGATTEPLIRRTLRGRVAWHATRAQSDAVRGAALALVTELDEHPEDDLTEALLGAPDHLLPSRRGVSLPTGRAPYAEEDLGMVLEQRMQAYDTLRAGVATALWGSHDAQGVIATIHERLCTIGSVRASAHPAPGAGPLLRQICQTRPDQIAALVDAAVNLPENSLDDHLHEVLNSWAWHDIDTFCSMLPNLLQSRTGVRRATARGFAFEWSALDPRLEAHQMEALRVGDPTLRDQLAAGMAPQLRRTPAATARSLAAFADDASWGITQALQAAGSYDLATWALTLDDEASAAVLDLTQRIGWDDANIQHLVSGIARRLPAPALDALTALAVATRHAPNVAGLPEALDQHPTEIATWIRGLLAGDVPPRMMFADLLLTAFGTSLTDGAEHALLRVVETADSDQLAHLVRGLRLCDGLVIARPNLVTAILDRAQGTTPADISAEINARLRDLAHPAFWSTAHRGEAAPELLHHRDRIAGHARNETLPAATRAFYRNTAEWLEGVIAREMRGDDLP
jgi:hypothetical protein